MYVSNFIYLLLVFKVFFNLMCFSFLIFFTIVSCNRLCFVVNLLCLIKGRFRIHFYADGNLKFVEIEKGCWM